MSKLFCPNVMRFYTHVLQIKTFGGAIAT